MGRKFRNKVKKYLENHLVLYSFYRVITNRKDTEYLETASQKYKPNSYRLLRDDIGFDNDRSVYFISYEWEDNGFFAIMRKCLSGCVIADSLGMHPYVNIENSLYNVPGGYNGTNNVFEYYFRPLINADAGEVLATENCFAATYDHIIRLNRSFGLANDTDTYSEYVLSDDYLRRLAASYRKYFVLKEDIEKSIRSGISDILGDSRTLGVHYRGTDFAKGLDGHPVGSTVEQYFELIDEAISSGFTKIFLATDDEGALKAFRERYPDMIICYSDVVRSDGEEGVHHETRDRKDDQYYMGFEVLRDMCTLSECDGLIAGLSQVSIFARIKKMSEGKEFSYMNIINNGIKACS